MLSPLYTYQEMTDENKRANAQNPKDIKKKIFFYTVWDINFYRMGVSDIS